MADVQIYIKQENGYQIETLSLAVFGELIEESVSITAVRLRKALCRAEGKNTMGQMTEAEQKFATLFKEAYDKAADVSTMSFEQVSDWIDTLQDIILTAKAQVQAATLAKNERKAKLSKEDRDKTPEGYQLVDASDSISSVKKRADRISKRDKMEQSLKDLGLSDEDVKNMMSKVAVNENGQPAKNAVTFHKTEHATKDVIAKIVDSINTAEEKEKSTVPVEPIEMPDFSKLFG